MTRPGIMTTGMESAVSPSPRIFDGEHHGNE